MRQRLPALCGAAAAVLTNSTLQNKFVVHLHEHKTLHQGDCLKKQSTQKLIAEASHGLDGRISINDERRTRRLTPPSQVVYGEITFEGVRVFMEHVLGGCEISSFTDGEPTENVCSNVSSHSAGNKHVFYDLGSGVGKMTLQVYLDYPQVNASIGVELSQERHRAAVTLHSHVLGDCDSACEPCQVNHASTQCCWQAQDGRCCKLRCEDILDTDFSDATIIWLANSFMSESFLEQLFDMMLHHAPRLQYIGVNDPLSEWDINIPGFTLDAKLTIPMSWDDQWTAYVYRRDDIVHV